MVVESLNDRIKKKFWELQDEQAVKKPSAQRFIPGPNFMHSFANYYKESHSKWVDFNQEIKAEIEDSNTEVVLFVGDKNKKIASVGCNQWLFPYRVEVRGAYAEANFVSSVFKKGFSVIGSDVGSNFNFSEAEFHGEVSFIGNLNRLNFGGAKFIDCGSIFFRGAVFNSNAEFSGCRLENSDMLFCQSNFFKMANFCHLEISGRVGFRFLQCNFHDSFEFYTPNKFKEGSSIAEINLSDSEFFKSVLFRQEFSTQSRYIKIGNLALSGTIFREPFVLKFFDLERCPDFSKSYLLDIKKLSLNEEAWVVDERSIEPDDEPKFRFLKKYFAEQGNHFKEREYFSYEMRAAEKMRLRKLQFSNPKTKIFAKDLGVIGLTIFKWAQDYLELILFKIYKWTSGYGASIFLPSFWLVASCAIVNLSFLVPLGSALELTIVPISRSESVKEIFKDTEPVLTVLSLINVALIFLLGLGLRNKFKIK